MTSIDDIRHDIKLHEQQPDNRIHPPSLGLRVSERRLLLALADILIINIALVIALALRTNLLPDPPQLVWTAKWFITLTVVWVVVAIIFDAYNLARAASGSHSLRTIAVGGATASFLYLIIPWLTPPIQNRSQPLLFIALTVTGLTAWRVLYARLFIQPTFQRRALIVGAGSSGCALAQALQSDHARQDANPFRGTGHILLGFVDDDPDRQDDIIAGLPVLGDSRRLVRLVRALNVDEIIVAITHAYQIRPELFEAILDCREMGLPITNMTTIYEYLTGRVAVEHASRNVETAAGRQDTPFGRVYDLVKLLADLAGALVGLLVLLLFIPIIALLNALFAPGPLFFRQTRVGLGGRPFQVLKFRSMVADAERDSGAVWASQDDKRVTAVGRVLRKTHLDELPQVWNVLKRQMSLVGPRPERPEFVRHLSRAIPFYRARHCVRPGITGWAQIHQNYGDSVEGAAEKLEFDLYYVKHASPVLDFIILLRTIAKVLGLRGR